MADVDISKIQLPDGTGCNLKDATARSTANSAYNAATTVANSSSYGVVKLSASVSSTSGTSGGIAATPSAVRSAYNLADSAYDLADAAYDDGTRTGDSYTQGQVKLSDSVDSDYDVSDGVAATPLAVKSVRDVVGEFNKNLIIFKPTAEHIDNVYFNPINTVSYYIPPGTERSTPVYGLSIKKTGKATSELYYTVNVSKIYLEGSSEYVISGCPSGGSISTYCLIVYDVLSEDILARCSGTDPTTFYIDQHKYVDVKIYINTESSSSTLTFTPMLCTKSAYDLDPSYTSQINAIANSWNMGKVKLSDAVDSESNSYASGVAATPYAVKQAYDDGTRTGNASTQGQVKLSDDIGSFSDNDDGIAATPYAVKQAYDKADAGMLYKNLLCVRRTESSYLYNNIHYDVVSDQSASNCGYIYVYGNNNGAASDVSYYVVNDRQVYLDPGEYILTGCPVGGSTTTYRLRAHNVENASVAIADDVGSGDVFTVTSRIAVQVRIYIYPAAGYISKAFRPMICLTSAYLADSSFVPGRFPVGTDAVYGMVKLTDAADVDHDAYEGIAASATAVHKAYSLANTANTAASTANTSLANKVQTLGYQTGTSPYLYYNKDGSSTKTSFCSMATSVTSGNSYPVTSGAVYTYLNNNYYDSDDVDDVISDRPQVVYSKAASKATSTSLSEISGLSYTTSGSYYYRITASLCWNATGCKAMEVRLIGRSSSGATGYCYARAVSDGTVDMGNLTCTALVYQMSRIFSVQVKSAASGNNVVSLLVERIPMNIT